MAESKEIFRNYDPGGHFCEMLGMPGQEVEHTRAIREHLDALGLPLLRERARAAERELFNLGITFTVYSDRNAIDRVLPFDVIPRLISAQDWSAIESGVVQRVTALNLFLQDIYGEARILADGIVPPDLVLGNPNYRPEMKGVRLPHGTYAHVCGVDLVRGGDGVFRILEDNCRTPSGVSYVIENRLLMMRAFPDLTKGVRLRDVSGYGPRLYDALIETAPQDVADPQAALLSPGLYNSAYFEHVFLARQMGVPLVEGRDLIVDENDCVQMKTTRGLSRVHVIYRRLDDAFLDPEAFRPDSLLGVRGLMRAYRAGKVMLANAIGTGVADDKAVYAYMPRIIRYYLDADPILPNVDTRICREPDALAYTLDNLDQLVVKPVGESGGYGITIGPRASKAELEECRARLLAQPENFISQPLVDLSVSPTLAEDGVAPRHVDLRPYVVTGASSWVLPGGLTRVALRKGSMIVNSSQGGGTKDSWVVG